MLFINEAQDMSPTMLDVCLKQNKPKIVVGDSHQHIKKSEKSTTCYIVSIKTNFFAISTKQRKLLGNLFGFCCGDWGFSSANRKIIFFVKSEKKHNMMHCLIETNFFAIFTKQRNLLGNLLEF